MTRAKEEGFVSHLLGSFPTRFIGAFAKGDLLQVLLISILTGFAISQLGALGEKISARHRRHGQGVLRRHPHHRAGGAGRRVRRHGVHRRGLWRRLAGQPDRADRDVLSHQPAVRAGRARHDRTARRLLDLSLPRLHQRRAADRARHVIVRDGAAAHDPEDGASRRLEIGGRPGHPHRLQLQPRRHQHLHDAGDPLPRAGDQHAAHTGTDGRAFW